MKIIELSEHDQYFMYGDEPEEMEFVKNPNLLQKVVNILFLILTVLGLIIIFSILHKNESDSLYIDFIFLSIGFICLIPAIVLMNPENGARLYRCMYHSVPAPDRRCPMRR